MNYKLGRYYNCCIALQETCANLSHFKCSVTRALLYATSHASLTSTGSTVVGYRYEDGGNFLSFLGDIHCVSLSLKARLLPSGKPGLDKELTGHNQPHFRL